MGLSVSDCVKRRRPWKYDWCITLGVTIVLAALTQGLFTVVRVVVHYQGGYFAIPVGLLYACIAWLGFTGRRWLHDVCSPQKIEKSPSEDEMRTVEPGALAAPVDGDGPARS